jgi:DNA-binding transcriptional ArsR family regulator
MARLMKVARMPPEVRGLIGRLRTSGRTIDEIHAKLGEVGEKVSRSALGRHIKRLDAARLADKPDAETIRRSLDRLEGAVAEVAEFARTILARLG